MDHCCIHYYWFNFSGVSDVLCDSRMATTIYVFDHAVLGVVSTYMVWNLVCIYHGSIYRSIIRCTFGDECVELCADCIFNSLFYRERRVLTFSNLWIISMFAILAHLVFTFMAQVMAGTHFSITRHWQTLVSSIFCWPVLYYLLRRWRI